jgi:hypothetical protein
LGQAQDLDRANPEVALGLSSIRVNDAGDVS